MIGLLSHFVVRNHNRYTDFPADPKTFFKRVNHAIRFVAHVSAIQTLELLEWAANFDHFFCGCSDGWLIKEASGNADGTSLHGLKN